MIRAALLLVVLAWAEPIAAAEQDGSGDSYWGPIPAADEVEAVAFTPRARPLWEWPLWAAWQPPKYTIGAAFEGGAYLFGQAADNQYLGKAYDFISLKWLPVEGRFGISLAGGDGFGVSYHLARDSFFGGDHAMQLGGRYSTERNSKAIFGLHLYHEHRRSLELGVGYRQKPNARFYGLGAESVEEDESFLTTENGWFGATLHQELGEDVEVLISGLYSEAGTRGPLEEETPPIDEVFAGEERPVGLGERSDGYSAQIELRHDTTLATGRPSSGGLRRIAANVFHSTDASDVAFVGWRAEMQQFFPLWFTRRSLALRGLVANQNSIEGGSIPFQRLMTNDDPDLFRGYQDQRWWGEGIAAVSAEYRWPVWNATSIDGLGVDAYAFFDWGQVFDESEDVALANLTKSYGGGLRLVTTPFFITRFEVGVSEEDVVLRLTAQQSFQFRKGGLFHGKNPIPNR